MKSISIFSKKILQLWWIVTEKYSHMKKTEWHTVKSVRIKRREARDTHTRLWCSGVNFPFIINKPHYSKEWASVLYLNKKPWLLYDLSEERQEDSRRKI